MDLETNTEGLRPQALAGSNGPPNPPPELTGGVLSSKDPGDSRKGQDFLLSKQSIEFKDIMSAEMFDFFSN